MIKRDGLNNSPKGTRQKDVRLLTSNTRLSKLFQEVLGLTSVQCLQVKSVSQSMNEVHEFHEFHEFHAFHEVHVND